MKRRNTADSEMIKDFSELKKAGITNFICTTTNGKKWYKPVMKHTAQGVSAYANSMYIKYGDSVKVEVGYFDNKCDWHIYTTYCA